LNFNPPIKNIKEKHKKEINLTLHGDLDLVNKNEWNNIIDIIKTKVPTVIKPKERTRNNT